MDLDFLDKQLLDGHKTYKTILSLTQYQKERLMGLASILYLSTARMVKTGIYDVDTKRAADTYTLCSSVFE